MIRALRVLLACLAVLLFAGRAHAAGADTCAATPPLLTTAGDPNGSTAASTNDIAAVPLSCNGIYQQVAGRDVLYRVVVGAGNAFTVTVTPKTSTYDPSIYLLSACGTGTTCSAGWGADSAFAGAAETLTFSGLAAGTYWLVVDSFYPGAGGDYALAVTGTFGAVTTTTALAATPTTTTFGQNVTFTATVGSAAATPNGNVAFRVDGTVMTTAALDANGKATFSTSALGVGSHVVRAEYAGATGYAASSAQIGFDVAKASTTTTLTSAGSPSTAGHSVVLMAHVTAANGGTPTGTVVFTIGGVADPPVALDAAGNATTSKIFTRGSYSVVATYAGDGSFTASTSAPITQVVAGATSTLALTASPSSSFVGDTVTFTAAVSGEGDVATGSVVFTVDGTARPAVTLDATGRAELVEADLAAGSHAVAADYAGDTLHDPASATLTHVVSVHGVDAGTDAGLDAGETSTGAADSGATGTADAGTTGDAGSLTIDAGPVPEFDAATNVDGCGCRTAGAGASPFGLLAAGLGAALALARRRRR